VGVPLATGVLLLAPTVFAVRLSPPQASNPGSERDTHPSLPDQLRPYSSGTRAVMIQVEAGA
jgi:hypothetical protein